MFGFGFGEKNALIVHGDPKRISAILALIFTPQMEIDDLRNAPFNPHSENGANARVHSGVESQGVARPTIANSPTQRMSAMRD